MSYSEHSTTIAISGFIFTHKPGPASQAPGRIGGLHSTLQKYLIVIDSTGAVVIAFSCVATGDPTRMQWISKPMIIQKILVKLGRSAGERKRDS